MFRTIKYCLLSVLLSTASFCIADVIEVTDSIGSLTQLEKPAKRIISLIPHATEMLFDIEAGDSVVGTVKHSEYPEAATLIPRVGDYYSINIELILEIKPDLIIAWPGGPTGPQLQQLEELGFKVFYSKPESLEQIAIAFEQFGKLTGKEKTAKAKKNLFENEISHLRDQYLESKPMISYFQIWHDPIITISRHSFIHEIIELCGGVNPFAELFQAAPQIGLESVLSADPDVIFVHSNSLEQADIWKPFPQIKAIKNNHVYAISPDIVARPGFSLLKGAASICSRLEQARH